MLKIMTVAVLFAVILPIYGENNGPQTASDKQASQAGKDPSPPADGKAQCTIKQDGTTIECDWSKGVPDSYFKRLFSAENAPNIALFLVGLLGICVALATLRKIERQTKATEDAANAAKVSADIAAGVSVPTLVLHEFKVGGLGDLTAESFFQYPRVKITVKNYGQTPALLQWWSICFTCKPLPNIPVYEGLSTGIILDKRVVLPGDEFTLPGLDLLHVTSFSPEDVQDILNRRKRFTAYGYVCYGDIFGNPLWRFKFCETALNIYHGEDICDWWSGFGPPAYSGIDHLPVQGHSKGEDKANPK